MFWAAPGLFSMMTGWFHVFASLSAMIRGMTSSEVPGGFGTTIFTVLLGYSDCAIAADIPKNNDVAA
jgi:hypothetical protein